MPRRYLTAEGIVPRKTRKRGSPSSSSSSVLQNFKFKKALSTANPKGRSRSRTPAPSWRLVGSRSPSCTLRISDSPSSIRNVKERATPPSARKLAATLWEISEMPSVRKKDELRRKRAPMSGNPGALPQFSDPSYSPISERIDKSDMDSRRRKSPSIPLKHRLVYQYGSANDSVRNAGFVEVDTRLKCHTPREYTVKSRLKEASNALTTSKELLNIITRTWVRSDKPSSTTSLISTLHSELQRARSHVNKLIEEGRTGQNEMMDYLMNCLAEERAAFRNKEREAIDSAMESVAGQLEAERKLRKRLESLNKKLGRELADVKSSYLNVVKQMGTMETVQKKERDGNDRKEDEEDDGEIDNVVDDKDDYARADSNLIVINEKPRHSSTISGLHVESAYNEEPEVSKVGDIVRQSFRSAVGRKSEHKTRKGIMGRNVFARLGSSFFFPSPTRQWGQPLQSKGSRV